MSAISGLTSTLARGIYELRRPGEGDLPGPVLWRVGQIVVALVIVLTNLVGTAAVLGIANFVIPLPSVHNPAHVRLVNGLEAPHPELTERTGTELKGKRETVKVYAPQDPDRDAASSD